MAEKLTARRIDAIRPIPGKRIELWDSAFSADTSLPGTFGLRVTETGAKSWQVMFRVQQPSGAMKQRRMAIGTYPAISLSDAREKAREALLMVGRGVDPAEHHKDALKRLAETPTVSRAIDDFIELYAKKKNRSWPETRRVFDRHIVPAWGDRLLPSITCAEVIQLLDEIAADAPYMANRVLATIRKFWNWCVEKGKVDASPVASVKAPGNEVSRDRVLSDAELKEVWAACSKIGQPFGPLFQLLIVTGQRLNEVAQMRWSEVDLDKAIWTLPREQTKSDRLHQVPLSGLALDLLASVPRGTGLYVFSTNQTSAVSGFSKARIRLDKEIQKARLKQAEAAATLDKDVQPMPAWRNHDLRRTAASGMARLKVEPWVVEKVLNHQSGQLAGVAGVYNRWGYDDQKRDALDRWAEHVIEVTA